MSEEEKNENNANSLKEVSERISKTLQNLIPKIPTLNIPIIKIPKLKNIQSPEVIKERNNWERHTELMNIQDSVLKVQEKILDEQKSTSKMTFVILILAILTLFATILTIILK
jgi:hypothetical protein